MSQPPRVGPSTGATTTPKAKTAMASAAFLGRKGLRAGSLATAAAARHRPRPGRRARSGSCRDSWRGAAGKRRNSEDDDASDQEALASETQREPAAGRQHDGVGDQVAGEDPGGFVVGGGEAAGDVGQRDAAMEVSSTSMNVGSITARAISQGLVARSDLAKQFPRQVQK